MKRKILALFILSIFLLSNSTGISQENELPSEEKCSEYISWLIYNYNNLIKINQRDKDGFKENKTYFSLYHEIGENFKILCLRANPVENRTITFLFEPIGNDDPIIIVNYTYILSNFLPIVYVNLIDGIIDDVSNTISIGVVFAEYGIATSKDKIINNTFENAYDFAKKIYKSDVKKIEKDKINEVLEPFVDKYFNLIFLSDELRKQYNEILQNISLNNNYAYKDFLPMFNELNQGVQWEKYGLLYIFINKDFRGYSYTILFTFIISIWIWFLDKKIPKQYLKILSESLGNINSYLPIPLYVLYWLLFPDLVFYKIIPLIPIIYYFFILTERYNEKVKKRKIKQQKNKQLKVKKGGKKPK